jgi:phosphohistidine swiveling domain-containing protein
MLERVRQVEWDRHGHYRSAILPSDYARHMGRKDFEREGIELEVTRLLKVNKDHCLDPEEKERITRAFYERIRREPAYLAEYFRRYQRDNESLLAYSLEVSRKSTEGLSNEELAGVLAGWFERLTSTGHWLWSLEFLNPALDRLLHEELAKLMPREKHAYIDETIAHLLWSERELPHQEEERALAELALEIQSTGGSSPYLEAPPAVLARGVRKLPLGDRIEGHWREWGWRNMYIVSGSPHTLEHFLDRIQQLLREGPESRLAQLRQAREASLRAREEHAELLEGREHLARFVADARDLAWLKTYRIDVYTLCCYRVRHLLEEAARRTGLTYDELTMLLPEEISEDLRRGRRHKRSLAERERHAFLLWDGEVTHVFGEDVKAVERAAFPPLEARDELTGVTAYPGRVRGPARVVPTDEDIHKVRPGDILIAHMTNPNYTPVFSKIRGIVTEEGGVLSHSAVIARELKLPCVIATKTAMSVFKDGELIEVDADRGIVRRLAS